MRYRNAQPRAESSARCTPYQERSGICHRRIPRLHCQVAAVRFTWRIIFLMESSNSALMEEAAGNTSPPSTPTKAFIAPQHYVFACVIPAAQTTAPAAAAAASSSSSSSSSSTPQTISVKTARGSFDVPVELMQGKPVLLLGDVADGKASFHVIGDHLPKLIGADEEELGSALFAMLGCFPAHELELLQELYEPLIKTRIKTGAFVIATKMRRHQKRTGRYRPPPFPPP